MADEHGIDLSQVEGTGIGGRIRKRDLVALIESGASTAPEETAEPEPSGPSTSSPPINPRRLRRAAPAQAGEGNGAAPADGRRCPASGASR